MGSKQAIPVALFAGGLPYVGAGAGNVGPLDGGDYVHVVVPDGAGGFNSRVTTLADLIAQVPASGISQAFADGRYLRRDQELADLLDFVAARTDLDVYSKTEVNAAIAAATAGAAGIYPKTSPNPASFSWMNPGPSTISTLADGSLSLVIPHSATLTLRGRVANLPGAAYTCTIGMIASPMIAYNYQGFGLVLYDSTSGKLQTIGIDVEAANTFVVCQNWSNFATSTGNIIGSRAIFGVPSPIFFKVVSDGAGLSFYLSRNGRTWTFWGTSLISANGTADKIGFYGIESGNDKDVDIEVFHWTLA